MQKSNKQNVPSTGPHPNKQQDEIRLYQEANRETRNVVTTSDPQLIRSFRGHQGAVNTVDFDPLMRQVASGSDDGLVYVWNFLPQKRPFKFVGHQGAVYDVHFTPDGESIVSAGEDRQIRIWKNSVQAQSRIIQGHSGAVRSIHFSNDGKLMLSGSDDKTMKIFNLSDGKFLQSFPGHKNWVREAQFSPDMRLIASASDDKSVRLWDLNTKKEYHSFLDHNQPVYTVQFSPDGTCLASGGLDRNIKLFDIRSQKIIQHYNAHEAAVNRVAFHQSGYYLTSVSQDSKIKIWDLRMGRIGWTLYSHQEDCRALNFNSRGDYFMTGGADDLVMVWKSNFEDGACEPHIGGTEVPISFDPQGIEQGVAKSLFKSNQIPLHQVDQNIPGVAYQNGPNHDLKFPLKASKQQELDEAESFKSSQKSKLSEVLAVSLEQIVNQLDFVKAQLSQIDDRLTQNEENVKTIFNNDRVSKIVERAENSIGKMNEDAQYAVFENFNQRIGFETGEFQSREEAVQEDWQNQVPEREDFDDEEIGRDQIPNNDIQDRNFNKNSGPVGPYEQSFGGAESGFNTDEFKKEKVQNIFQVGAMMKSLDRPVDNVEHQEKELERQSNQQNIDNQDLEQRDRMDVDDEN